MFEYEFVLVNPVGQEPDDVTIDYPELRVLVEPKSVVKLTRPPQVVDASFLANGQSWTEHVEVGRCGQAGTKDDV